MIIRYEILDLSYLIIIVIITTTIIIIITIAYAIVTFNFNIIAITIIKNSYYFDYKKMDLIINTSFTTRYNFGYWYCNN